MDKIDEVRDATMRPYDGVPEKEHKPKDSVGQPAHCKPQHNSNGHL